MSGIAALTWEARANPGSAARNGMIRVGPRDLIVRQGGVRRGDVPAMPSGLQARRLNARTVELTWKDGAGETGYELRRRGRAYRIVPDETILPADTTRFRDGGLLRGMRYCYILRARGERGASAGAKVCIRTPR